MTSSGQCRLAPLILCVQDSCQLYDYTVKLLFKLHSSKSCDCLPRVPRDLVSVGNNVVEFAEHCVDYEIKKFSIIQMWPYS